MFFQIKEIILWSRDQNFSIRRIEFEPGKVTVISGASRTGKSAVIPIIDYCLASNTCNIPVNTIRQACEWFGIIVKTEMGEMLLARREPGNQRSTDDMYMSEAEKIKIPPKIYKNRTAPEVRRYLDELAGLTNLDFRVDDNKSGFDARPSFRDMSAFIFQPQNVVANPEVLFYKTDRNEYREKLKRIFPYVLGAITPELLVKQHELQRLQKDLTRKERELKNVQQVSAQWTAELSVKISEARELGLISVKPGIELTHGYMFNLLQKMVERTDISPSVSGVTISQSIEELKELEQEEIGVSRELTAARRRLNEMTRVRESASDYYEALRIQRDRLNITDWLYKNRSGEEVCPVCGNCMESCNNTIKELKSALTEIEEGIGNSLEVPAAFDREMERVRNDMNTLTEKLTAIQLRRSNLSKKSEEANALQYQASKVERFIGNIENALNLHKKLGRDEELYTEIEKLRAKCEEIRSVINEVNIEKQKERALGRINAYAARMLPNLDCERPDDPVSLKINDLTIKVTGTMRDDYLSEIGSGSNWLSYHIAMILSLHKYFLQLNHSPVPGFLIMDQPSQVYFPRKLVVRETDEQKETELSDDEIKAVRKAFKTIAEVVGEAYGKLQVIILDHASENIWGDIPNVVSFEEWRNGAKLVPQEWLSGNK